MADINDTKTPNVSRNKVDAHKPHNSETARTVDGDAAHRSRPPAKHKKSGSNWLLISAVVLAALLALAFLFGGFDGETIAVLPVDGGSEEVAAPTDGIATTAPEVIETETAVTTDPDAIVVDEVEETAAPTLSEIETDAEVTTVPVTPVD